MDISKSELNSLPACVKNLITTGKIPQYAQKSFVIKWKECENTKSIDQTFDLLEYFVTFFKTIKIELEDICLMEIMSHLDFSPTVCELIEYILMYRLMYKNTSNSLRDFTQPDVNKVYRHIPTPVNISDDIPNTPIYVPENNYDNWLERYNPN